jgi:hypothetical protein
MIINMPDINDHEKLAANREAMIVKLRARLNVFENRYEVSSSRVHAAIDQGIIRETAEVTSWLMAWHRQHRQRGGPGVPGHSGRRPTEPSP